MSKVFRAKNIRELQGENMGFCVDFGVESEDENNEKYYKQFVEENQEGHDQEIRDFIKKYPLPGKADGIRYELFWALLVDDYVEDSGIDKTSVRFCMEIDIIRRMYENI